MKKFLSVCLAGSLAISIYSPFVASAASDEQQKVIVVFEDKVDKEAVTDAEGKINQQFKNIPVASVTVPADEVKELKNDPSVVHVEKDILVHTKAQTIDWGIQATNTPVAWKQGYTGKGIKVAVVDTGVSPHKDLVLAGGKSFVNYTSSYTDDNGHGTHVAGIIGAKDNQIGTKGVAPDAGIYAVKSLDRNGAGYLSSILAGVDWAITNKMDIINLSLGTQTHSEAFQTLVDKAYSNGILIVAAAGNDGTANGSGDTVDYPARYDSVVGVAAVDSSYRRASFSSTGNAVEVAAPGVSILATYLNNGYARMSGTSMAAPYIAGELALLKQANPTASNTDLRKKLIESSKDLGTAGRDAFYGYGFAMFSSGSFKKNEVAPSPVLSPITGLILNIKSVSALPGETKGLTVSSAHKDGTKVDRTKEAVWKSENPNIATVDGGQVTIKQFGKTNITASFGGRTVKIPVYASVSRLTPDVSTVSGKPGTKAHIKLTATLTDGRKVDVTNKAAWKLGNGSISAVQGGEFTIQKPGKTFITGSFGGREIKILIDGKR
ncbi:MAG TPA: S8 family peptidase [Chondromyces sp.]|nr:S8 family peptidase [Chondromyces sp.]